VTSPRSSPPRDHRPPRGLGAGPVGVIVFVGLYTLIAAQQFTRYAQPAGMDLTIAGVAGPEAVRILVDALWPVIVTVNATLLGFHAGVGFVFGLLAGGFWDAVFRLRGRVLDGRARSLFVAGSLLLVAALAFGVIAVRYPFQYDHLLNAQDGVLRRLHDGLTSHVSPTALTVALWGTITLLALPALVRTMSRSWAIASLLLLGVVSLGAWRVPSAAPGSNAGPNVVLVFLESARSDYFSINGHARATSPNFDRLVAADGVTFTRAWSHINGTVESVVTVMTSAYPHQHGIRTMFHNDALISTRTRTLPALLREHGYATRVVTDWDGDVTYFNEQVLPGFDEYDVAEFGVVNYVKQIYAQYFIFYALTDNEIGHRLFATFYRAGGGFTPAGSDAYYRTRIASHLAELATTRRFFLTLFFSNAHMNYRCAYPYYQRFTDPDYQGLNKYAALSNPLVTSPTGLEREARQIRGLYEGCVAALDDNVGFVAETLRALSLDRQTILVVTGDHGEKLPDGRAFRYGRNAAWLEPAEFHVPLAVIAPALGVGRRRIEAPARHVDILPTVLELVGLPVPAGLNGESLVPLIRGEGIRRSVDVFAETGFHWTPVAAPYLGYPPMTHVVQLRLASGGALIPRYFLRPECLPRITLAKHRFIRTERYHLNHRPTTAGATLELYDWRADPAGTQNLVTTRPDVAADLRNRLFQWASGDPDLLVRDGRLVPRHAGAMQECSPER
jgi:arylsulfatase A-like enzyme